MVCDGPSYATSKSDPAIKAHINAHNTIPKQFIWTVKAVDVLESQKGSSHPSIIFNPLDGLHRY